MHPRDVQRELYGMVRMSRAHLFSRPVLEGFDAVRKCSHCRRRSDHDRAVWGKERRAVAVLRGQAIRLVRGVIEPHHSTDGCAVTIYEFADVPVADFAPNASDFVEAGS